MSFKRDGDDKSALDNQRKRRVAELLYEDIDDEEMTQLSNGKLKCKMCSHQPIFDTLNMFYVHRQGKKHQYSLEYAEQQKQELKDLIKKRQHDQLAKAGNTITNQQTSKEKGALKGVKETLLGVKKSRRPHDRRPVIDFDIHVPPNTEATASCSVETTSDKNLPGNQFNSFHFTNKSENSLDKRTVGNKTVEKFADVNKKPRLSTAGSKGTLRMEYKSQSALRAVHESSVVSAKDVHKLVGKSNSEHNNKYYLSRKKQRDEANSLVRNMDKGILDKTINQPTLPSQTWEFYKDFKGKVPFKMKSVEKPVTKLSSDTDVQWMAKTSVSIGLEDVKSTDTHDGTGSSTEKKERAKKYLNALGSGWKKDWTGAWIKDEDAEFDSDEEPPDI